MNTYTLLLSINSRNVSSPQGTLENLCIFGVKKDNTKGKIVWIYVTLVCQYKFYVQAEKTERN